MSEEMAQFRTEGENAFPDSDTENENSTSSPEGEETDGEKTQSPDGENNQDAGQGEDDPDKDKPFHEHPRWKQRETEWTSRFNDQEKRHQDDMQKILDKLGGDSKPGGDKPLTEQIPAWFGGDQQAWDDFRAYRKSELDQVREETIKGINEKSEAEQKAIKEATDYMQTEIAAIEADKEFNPKGEKIDANKLLKFTLDNYLIDEKGRWDYRKAYRFMKGSSTTTPTGNRKEIAGATTSESKAETKPSAFKTSEDYRKPGSRPW